MEIGLSDNLDKGLGYERVNLANSNHQYAKLTREHRDILSNLRLTLIEFIIRLAGIKNFWFIFENTLISLIKLEKLINENSSDTILLILISRVVLILNFLFY